MMYFFYLDMTSQEKISILPLTKDNLSRKCTLSTATSTSTEILAFP